MRKIFIWAGTLIFYLIVFVITGSHLIFAQIPARLVGLDQHSIEISGTGSMYPTFPKGHGKDPQKLGEEVVATAGMLRYPNGIEILGKRLIGHELERGDIIVFENERIRILNENRYGKPSGLVKRVIALPGDTLLIKDGLVYLNEKVLKEPYIAAPRSTFGGSFLKDCTLIKIPENKVFVMGDNRKGSDDSRDDVGFVDYKDIEFILPYKDQVGKLDSGWHNPENDDKESARIVLNQYKYLELVNNERQKQGLKPLRYEDKLQTSAALRAQKILEFNDMSWEATKSGYTMRRATTDASYSNIIYGELPVLGYYNESELFEYAFEFPKTKAFFLNKDYQDLGIASVRGNLNNCPANIVVFHIAGYVPPNYTPSQIESFRKVLDNLREISEGWKTLKDVPSIYDNNRKDVDRINQIIEIRITNLSGIVATMERNQWLSSSQDSYLDQDPLLSKEQNEIAERLNKK